MRKFLVVAAAVAITVATAFSAVGQSPNAQPPQAFERQRLCLARARPQVLALMAQYPEGGAGLRNAVARAVQVDPEVAQDWAAASREANPSQRRAIGAGLADALDYFRRANSSAARDAQRKIERALRCGAPETIAAANAQLLSAFQGVPGFNADTTAADGIVSPSRP